MCSKKCSDKVRNAKDSLKATPYKELTLIREKLFSLTTQPKTTAFFCQNNGVESLKQRRSSSFVPKNDDNDDDDSDDSGGIYFSFGRVSSSNLNI